MREKFVLLKKKKSFQKTCFYARRQRGVNSLRHLVNLVHIFTYFPLVFSLLFLQNFYGHFNLLSFFSRSRNFFIRYHEIYIFCVRYVTSRKRNASTKIFFLGTKKIKKKQIILEKRLRRGAREKDYLKKGAHYTDIFMILKGNAFATAEGRLMQTSGSIYATPATTVTHKMQRRPEKCASV